jgi:hypothetical protein
MPKAAIVTLADEVTADLNKKAGAWSMPFKAERVYFPKTDFETTDTLKVHVSAAGWTKVPDNRRDWRHEYDIEIGVQYKPSANAGDQAKPKFDELMKLVEEIGDHYEDTRPTVADAVLVAVAYGPGGTGQPYVPGMIDTHNLFVGVIRLTFRKWR